MKTQTMVASPSLTADCHPITASFAYTIGVSRHTVGDVYALLQAGTGMVCEDTDHGGMADS